MSETGGRQRITRELLFGAFVGPQNEADDPRIRERVIASVEERDCEPGDTLFVAGEPSDHVHFMTEGRVRLARPGYADWVYDGRWVMGTTDALAGRPRLRTATVETPMRTFRLPSEYWFSVMRDKPVGLLNTILGYIRGSVRYATMLAPSGGFEDSPRRAAFDVSSSSGRLRVLAATPILAKMPAQLLLELAAAAEERVLAPDETIFVAGEPHADLVVVARGAVALSRSNPEVAATFGPGEAVGGPICIGDADAAWTARAVGETRVVTIAIETLYDDLEDHIEGMRALMTTLALEQERLCEALAAREGELVLT